MKYCSKQLIDGNSKVLLIIKFNIRSAKKMKNKCYLTPYLTQLAPTEIMSRSLKDKIRTIKNSMQKYSLELKLTPFHQIRINMSEGSNE